MTGIIGVEVEFWTAVRVAEGGARFAIEVDSRIETYFVGNEFFFLDSWRELRFFLLVIERSKDKWYIFNFVEFFVIGDRFANYSTSFWCWIVSRILSRKWDIFVLRQFFNWNCFNGNMFLITNLFFMIYRSS